MNVRPPQGRRAQGRRAGRPNLYPASPPGGEWARYDPYESEISALPPARLLLPGRRVPTGPGPRDECPVYELPLRPAFVRPFTAADVGDAAT